MLKLDFFDNRLAETVLFVRLFVKWFSLCYLTVVCMSCLSVCPVRNVAVLWPNGWTDQGETWLSGRLQPWPHCVRWGPRSPSPKGAQPPIFGQYLLWPNGSMDPLDRKVGLDPSDIVLDGDPALTPQKRGQSTPSFRPMSVAPKRLDGSTPNGCMDQDAIWYGGRPQPRPYCAIWEPAPQKAVSYTHLTLPTILRV